MSEPKVPETSSDGLSLSANSITHSNIVDNSNNQGQIKTYIEYRTIYEHHHHPASSVSTPLDKPGIIAVPEDTLDEHMQNAIVHMYRGEIDKALAILTPYFNQTTYLKLPPPKQDLLVHHFFHCHRFLNTLPEALDHVESLSLPQMSLTLSAWRHWIDFKSGKDPAGQDLDYLLRHNGDHSVVLELALLDTESPEKHDIALHNLNTEIQRNDFDQKKYCQVLFEAAFYCAQLEDYQKAFSYLNLIVPKNDFESLYIDTAKLQLQTAELCSSPLLKRGIHLTRPQWNTISSLYNQTKSIRTQTIEAGVPSMLIDEIWILLDNFLCHGSNVYSYVREFSSETLQQLHPNAAFNILTCFHQQEQHLELINSYIQLSSAAKKHCTEIYQVALLISDQKDLIEPNEHCTPVKLQLADAPNYESFPEPLFTPRVMALNYIKKSDEKLLNAIRGLPENSDYERIGKAHALSIIGLTKEDRNQCECAVRLFSQSTITLEPGVGEAAADYLRCLEALGNRHQLDTYVENFPPQMVVTDPFFFRTHFNHIATTQGITALEAFLAPLLEIENPLQITIREKWLRCAAQLQIQPTIAEKLSTWPIPDGVDEITTQYISTAFVVSPDIKWIITLYDRLHKVKNPVGVWHAIVKVFFDINQKGHAFPEIKETKSQVDTQCIVILNTGKYVLFDKTFDNDSCLPICYPTHDTAASDLFGNRVNDRVTFEGKTCQIKAIENVYVGAFNYSLQELSKRSNVTGMHAFSSVEAVTAHIQKINEQKENRQTELRAFVKKVLERELPLVASLTRCGVNPLVAFDWAHDTHFKSERFTAQYSHNTVRELTEERTLVWDASALYSDLAWSFKPQLLNNTFQSALPPVTVQYLQEAIDQGGMTHSLADTSLNITIQEFEEYAKNSGTVYPAMQFRLENLFEGLSQSIISEVAAIPQGEIPNDDLAIVAWLDECTRDAVFACYGHDNRTLVTNDPSINKYASRLGIGCISTVELCTYVCSLGDEDPTHPLNFIGHTMSRMWGSMLPGSVFVTMLNQDFPQGMIDRFCQNIPAPFPISQSNLSILVRLLTNYDCERCDYLCEHILNFFIDEEKSKKTLVLQILFYIAKLHSNPLRSSVHIRIVKFLGNYLGIDLDIQAPFSNQYQAEMIWQELLRKI